MAGIAGPLGGGETAVRAASSSSSSTTHNISVTKRSLKQHDTLGSRRGVTRNSMGEFDSWQEEG